MSASDQIDGNRLIFKPSPLQGLKKTARPATPGPAKTVPLEVTAVPQATAPTPEARPAAPVARHRDDVTTFSLEPLPAMAAKSEALAKDAEATPSPPSNRLDEGRILSYVLLAAAAGAILLALVWLGLI